MQKIELIPVNEMLKLDKMNLDDIADRLWHEYFDPAERHTPEVKKFIMQQYNYVIDKINKEAGFKRQISLTSSTIWKNEKKENPDMKRVLYIEVNRYDKRYERAKEIYETITDSAAAIVKTITAKPVDRSKLKTYPGTKGKVVHMETTNESKPRVGSDKWIEVYNMHNDGKTNEQIIEKTGYTAKQVRDAIYRYKTNRVKGALTK